MKFEIAYILTKHYLDNPMEQSRAFNQSTIYQKVVDMYSIDDIRNAFYFLYDNKILGSSVREKDGFIIVYRLEKTFARMYTKMFWLESKEDSKKRCRQVLNKKYIVEHV